MKYYIDFKCGHGEQIDLGGKVKDREYKLEYLREYGCCSECYKKQKQAEYRQKQKDMGFRFRYSYTGDLYGDGKIECVMWFCGDTFPHKEDIKKLGYKYGRLPERVDCGEEGKVWHTYFSVDSENTIAVKEHGDLCVEIGAKYSRNAYIESIRCDNFNDAKAKIKGGD